MDFVTIAIIAVLSLKMQEGYLADVSLIYAMLSFLAVVVLTKVYMGVYLARKDDERRTQQEKEHSEEKEDMNHV